MTMGIFPTPQEQNAARQRAIMARRAALYDPIKESREVMRAELTKAYLGQSNDYDKASFHYINLMYQQGLAEYHERNRNYERSN